MILGVKIRNNKSGLFRLKDGTFSKNGKTYSTLSFAKTSITKSIGWYNVDAKLLDCDFVVFNDDSTIEVIPVKTHIIDYFERELTYKKGKKEEYEENNYNTKYIDEEIFKITSQLKYLKERGNAECKI